ncbi:uncharacterized protein LOC144708891 [Wolffia australiana]
MPCVVPLDKKMDLSFFAFRQVGVFPDELIESLKLFSYFCEDLGCVYSAVFKCVHGNLIVWYGAWIKRPEDERRLLYDHLVSTLERASHLGALLDHGFFETYAGMSKDGRSAVRFVKGDTVWMAAMTPNGDDPAKLSYACMAVFKSCYLHEEGVAAGACFTCLDKPMVASVQLWRSLFDCYSWLIRSSHRTSVRPFLAHLSDDCEFELFTVVFVSSDELPPLQLLPSPTRRAISAGPGQL